MREQVQNTRIGKAEHECTQWHTLHRQRPSGAGKDQSGQGRCSKATAPSGCPSPTPPAPPRPGEANGRDYHFVSREQFRCNARPAGVPGKCRGVRQPVWHLASRGCSAILPTGATSCWKSTGRVPRRCEQDFPGPPPYSSCRPRSMRCAPRLAGRGQDSARSSSDGIAAAAEEISHAGEFDYIIVNDDFDEALSRPDRRVSASPCRRHSSGTMDCSTNSTGSRIVHESRRFRMARITVDDCIEQHRQPF